MQLQQHLQQQQQHQQQMQLLGAQQQQQELQLLGQQLAHSEAAQLTYVSACTPHFHFSYLLFVTFLLLNLEGSSPRMESRGAEPQKKRVS